LEEVAVVVALEIQQPVLVVYPHLVEMVEMEQLTQVTLVRVLYLAAAGEVAKLELQVQELMAVLNSLTGKNKWQQ
jgi:hypothetical protein